jgi:hypothetical protein
MRIQVCALFVRCRIGRKAALFLAYQIVEFFDQFDEFGVVFLYLNLVHELVHPRALLWGHRGESSRQSSFTGISN